MSELEKKNRYDYSKYDEMSTETLEEILRMDFQMSEDAESDIDAILYISEVIAQREKDLPDVEAAWKQFNTKYRPYVTDGRSLYDFGDEDDAPEAAPDHFAAESNSHTFHAAPQRKRQRGTRRLVRLAVIAAVMTVFLFATSATAYALGYDLWGAFIQWTKETFSFVSPAISESDAETNWVSNLSEGEYATLQDALTAYGVTESLVPTWIPDNFAMQTLSVSENAKPGCVVFYTTFSCQDKWLTVQINMYHSFDNMDYTIWQKDEAEITSIDSNGHTFYMVENAGRWSATWTDDLFECNITGDVTSEELVKIIESIYEKDE